MLGLLSMTAALAAGPAPGGYRVGPGVPQTVVTLREAWVVNPGEPHITQTTLHLQGAYKWIGADLTLPAVYAWRSNEWSDGGLGNLRLGLRFWAKGSWGPWSVGLEGAFPVAPRQHQVVSWGSVARETLPGVELVIVGETTIATDSPWTIRVALGAIGSVYRPYDVDFGPTPQGELAIVKVVPVAGRWSTVIEAEVLNDPTPASLRVLGRWTHSESYSFDVGLQLPIWEMATRPASVQFVGGARAFF